MVDFHRFIDSEICEKVDVGIIWPRIKNLMLVY
jgi:hypothetical protein